MQLLAALVRIISGLNAVIGKTFAWLSLAMVIVCFTVVVQRYFFATSILWMQDLYVWINGFMFTAVAGYALLRDDHVRVDILYAPAPLKRKALIDLMGVVLFLLPFCWVVYSYSWTYIMRSWRLMEGSANVGGMPGLYILKSFILVFVVVVSLQGIAMAARSILVLAGREDLLPPHLRYKTKEE
ncbi:TRAP transporter small permease subunit [Falsigemmobacter intermedius]|uniref:TRAP transporter small permease protein n=1 Tax=Falsigemmobacter intermedius TaxID=1553448 RepID=A0A3S3VM26_9RHOB|nr:TRAP transporter small permease subunit [Falsigemmobacter intermedius]RWY38760.1 TRAP transporter small permease subunit [Falsigemmobacter intermedius]